MKRICFPLLLLLVLFAPLAQASDPPTIAILRFGSAESAPLSQTEKAIVDVLQASGLITPQERAQLGERMPLANDRLGIIWGDAAFDFAFSAQMVESALDQGADVLIAISSPVTQAALQASLDMDDPPAVIFASVFNSVDSGITQAACLKADHVTGVEAHTPYEDILPLLTLQNPNLQIIGTLYNPSEISGVAGVEAISQSAADLGIQVEVTSVAGIADLRPATEALINKGAEMLLLPIDQTTLAGMPAILAVANDNGIPVFHANARSIALGATVGAGFELFYEQGVSAAHILVAYLNGDIDIATTGVSQDSNLTVGVNLDAAAELDMEIAPDLVEMASRVVEGGQLSLPPASLTARFQALGLRDDELPAIFEFFRAGVPAVEGMPSAISQIMVRAMQFEGARQTAQEFLDSLLCTPEMIAEQQAALDASE